jgi:aspartyl protease family protein
MGAGIRRDLLAGLFSPGDGAVRLAVAIALGMLMCEPRAAHAADVALIGSMGSRAVLVIDGGAPRTVAVGGVTPEGVRLLAVEGEHALVEVDGRPHRLRLGARPIQIDPREPAAITLHADARGHFGSDAIVNGARMPFLVDTGATLFFMGQSDARRAGIDFQAGTPITAQTAAGPVQAWRVRLARVQIGAVTLHDVDAAVLEQDLPVALLGMSVLNRMEMQRQGNTLTLHKRF